MLLLVLVFTGKLLRAQDDIFKDWEKRKKSVKSHIKKKKEEEFKNGWNPYMVSAVLLTQSSYKDWAKGGENSLAWTLNHDGLFVYRRNRFFMLIEFKTAFGQSKLGGQQIRKTEDRLQLETTLRFQVKKYLTPFVSNLIQTQFAPGYRYGNNPATGTEIREQISNFWDPAYVYQSLGLITLPAKGVSIRLGVAVREIFTRKFHNYSGGNWAQIDSGLELVYDFNRKVAQNTLVKSNFRLYSTFKDFQEVNVVWDNQLILKINKLFSANAKALLIYDPEVVKTMQIQEILGIGINYSFF